MSAIGPKLTTMIAIREDGVVVNGQSFHVKSYNNEANLNLSDYQTWEKVGPPIKQILQQLTTQSSNEENARLQAKLQSGSLRQIIISQIPDAPVGARHKIAKTTHLTYQLIFDESSLDCAGSIVIDKKLLNAIPANLSLEANRPLPSKKEPPALPPKRVKKPHPTQSLPALPAISPRRAVPPPITYMLNEEEQALNLTPNDLSIMQGAYARAKHAEGVFRKNQLVAAQRSIDQVMAKPIMARDPIDYVAYWQAKFLLARELPFQENATQVREEALKKIEEAKKRIRIAQKELAALPNLADISDEDNYRIAESDLKAATQKLSDSIKSLGEGKATLELYTATAAQLKKWKNTRIKYAAELRLGFLWQGSVASARGIFFGFLLDMKKGYSLLKQYKKLNPKAPTAKRLAKLWGKCLSSLLIRPLQTLQLSTLGMAGIGKAQFNHTAHKKINSAIHHLFSYLLPDQDLASIAKEITALTKVPEKRVLTREKRARNIELSNSHLTSTSSAEEPASPISKSTDSASPTSQSSNSEEHTTSASVKKSSSESQNDEDSILE